MTLADLRKSAGMTQAQVAKKMYVSQAQISRIEGMFPDVMFPSLRAYLDAIGTDIRFVLNDVFDVVSGEVTSDNTRTYAEKRRQDPTRRGPHLSGTESDPGSGDE